MGNRSQAVKNSFLYAISPYHGNVTTDKVVFNAKLQEFSHKVGFIANLYTSGKLLPKEAYGQLESLWKELEVTKIKVLEEEQK